MGLAVRADGDAGMGGAHLDVEVRDAHRVADLLPAAAGAKDCKGTGEDGAAGKRQAAEATPIMFCSAMPTSTKRSG